MVIHDSKDKIGSPTGILSIIYTQKIIAMRHMHFQHTILVHIIAVTLVSNERGNDIEVKPDLTFRQIELLRD